MISDSERQSRDAYRKRHYVGAHAYANKADDTRTKHEAMRLVADIPADTRSLTARLMGDPLPGRSALDRQNKPGLFAGLYGWEDGE